MSGQASTNKLCTLANKYKGLLTFVTSNARNQVCNLIKKLNIGNSSTPQESFGSLVISETSDGATSIFNREGLV